MKEEWSIHAKRETMVKKVELSRDALIIHNLPNGK
jgi:hypothetical protein